MTFDQFIKETKGKNICVPWGYCGECVSLVQIGMNDVYGIPLKARGDAKYYGNNIIKNGYGYEVEKAEKGDLLVYDYLGGGYGHVAFYVDKDTIYDQNNGHVKPTRTAQLRPNNLGKPSQIIRMKTIESGVINMLDKFKVGDEVHISTEFKSHHEDQILANDGTKEKPIVRYVIHKYPKDKHPLALSKTRGGLQSGATNPVNVYSIIREKTEKPKQTVEEKSVLAIKEIKDVIKKYEL